MGAKDYINKLEKLSVCIFQTYNLELEYNEEMRMAKIALNAFKEEQLEKFPYDSIADYFSEEVMKYTGRMQDYTIERLLVKLNVQFAVFHLAEFKDNIENPIWERACDRVQSLFVTFAEVLRAAGKNDKIAQVPHVSYMKTMIEELGLLNKDIPLEGNPYGAALPALSDLWRFLQSDNGISAVKAMEYTDFIQAIKVGNLTGWNNDGCKNKVGHLVLALQNFFDANKLTDWINAVETSLGYNNVTRNNSASKSFTEGVNNALKKTST